MSSDCWFDVRLDDGPKALPPDLHYEDLWLQALERRGETMDGEEGKYWCIHEDVEALMEAGFSGTVRIASDSEGEAVETWFRPGRRLEVSDSRAETAGALLNACWKQQVCSSCRHQLRCGLGTMKGNYWWQPGEDQARCEQAVFLVPKGFAAEISPPVLSRA